MSFTLCTSGAAVWKAGENVNSNIKVSGAAIAQYSDEAEGTICLMTRKDWITNYSSVDTSLKGALARAAACKIGIDLIEYDMSGYTGLNEASTMVDILTDQYLEIINYLKDEKNQKLNK